MVVECGRGNSDGYHPLHNKDIFMSIVASRSAADRFDEAVQAALNQRRLHDGKFPESGFGGLLRQIKELTEARIKSFRNNYPLRNPLPEVIVDFTDGRMLDASAIKYGGEYFIAIPVATPLIIYGTMLRLLSHPNVLADIGDPSNEVAVSQIFPVAYSLDELDKYVSKGTIRKEDCRPKNKDREMAAKCLAQLTIEFIIAHEFRHIHAGHLGYLFTNSKMPIVLAEMCGQQGQARSSMKRQALEMDADCYGMATVLRACLQHAGNHDIPYNWGLVLPSREQTLFHVLFSVAVFFKLINTHTSHWSNWKSELYPPVPLRAIMAMATAYECLLKGEEIDLLIKREKIVTNVVVAVEQGFANITGDEKDNESIKAATSPEAHQHVRDKLQTWEEVVRRELEPYSYVELPPQKIAA
jgi:hypothetical protein